jgi:hypothetical protein
MALAWHLKANVQGERGYSDEASEAYCRLHAEAENSKAACSRAVLAWIHRLIGAPV